MEGRRWTWDMGYGSLNLPSSIFHLRPQRERFFGRAASLSVFVALLLVGAFKATASADRATVILVVGAPGEAEFGSNFVRQVTLWQEACAKADCRQVILGLDTVSQTNDYELLHQTLAAEPKD